MLGLLVVILLVLQVVSFFRRKPPLDTELQEFRGLIGALSAQCENLSDEVAEWQSTHSGMPIVVADFRARLDKLETRHERDAGLAREKLSERVGEIYEAIGGVNESLNKNMQSVESRLGNIEGTITGLRDRMPKPSDTPP